MGVWLRPLGFNRQSESGTWHQQHGKDSASEDVERNAEAGPPYRDTWVLNQEVMNGTEDSVSCESSRSQPQVLPEADHRHYQKRQCCQRFQREHWRGTSHGRK